MRESNFAFPAQNKACVCITSQLYDRRALDTTSPLPLFNSLTHLTYLTSTSPRIREIMTMDGGLERLVKILHEFCMCPPPPENPAILYGLTPPNARLAKLSPALNPHSFDKHAAYRFSLAFQCIVNIGVRGSEPIRSRVVQAGTLDVVGCILEAWLANKGFAVGPSSSATGIPRETREQRQQRRLAQIEHRQREDAAHLQRALQRELQVERRRNEAQDESMDYSPAESSTSHILLLSDSFSQPSNSNSDTDVSADNSITVTPQGTGTPTGSVIVPSRDRSGTIIGRPVWDQPPATTAAPPRGRRNRHRELPPESPSPTTDTSRADTETEDDGDGDMDMDRTEDSERIDSDVASASASPSPERRPRTVPRHNLARRAVGIVSDEPNAGPQTLQVGGLGLDTDAHIIINEAGGVGDGGVGVEVGVEDGIVSLEPNDDFAMGAPPGAPGAIGEGTTPRALNLNTIETGRRRNTIDAPDVTPRAAVIGLPMMTGVSTNGALRGANQPTATHGHQRTATLRGRPAGADATNAGVQTTGVAATAAGTAAAAASLNNPLGALGGGRTTSGSGSHSHHHRDSDSGPYRDEDVLLSLQLLAYLSKYPHVRQAFYKPRVTFHPASVNLPGARFGVGQSTGAREKEKQKEREKEKAVILAAAASSATTSSSASSSTSGVKEGFFRAFNAATGGNRGKDRATQQASSASQAPVIVAPATGGAPSSARQTNVFSLVERFTFKPSSTETDLPNPPPRLPPEIQYWAGVIMRNACRKDDSRGGIRQCANMMCGKWETYPREFAKCRRCRKAKYCGKECQSTAWSEGHRFWCSAKDVDEDNLGDHSTANAAAANHSADQLVGVEGATDDGNGPVLATTANGTGTTPRRQPRERHGHNHHGATGDGDVATVRGYRPPPAVPSALTALQTQPSAYVTPTTSTTTPMSPSAAARAESSMTRDRTIQQNTASFIPSLPSRSRATARPLPTQNQDPTNTSYLSFQIQANNLVGQVAAGYQRRRAETITGPLASSSSSPGISASSAAANAATMRAEAQQRMTMQTEVAPNFVIPTRTQVDQAVSPLTSNPDWLMGGAGARAADTTFPPTFPSGIRQDTGSSRRHRPSTMPTSPRRSPPSENEHDHMVLG